MLRAWDAERKSLKCFIIMAEECRNVIKIKENESSV